jgi:rare lipoprotein A
MGEPYDMYGMTAAHKTLPLPAYVRVTNLENGRSVVLRVNDRGPFVGNRIIDLSYTAAAKLDMLRNGTAMVEVRAVQPSDPARDLNVAAPGAPGAPNLGAAAAAPASAFASASTLAAAPAPAPSPTTFAPAGISTADRTVAPAVAPPGTPATVPTGAAAPTHAIGPAPVPAPVPAGVPAGALYVQAGAFADPANAQRLAGKLRDAGYGGVFVRDDLIAGHRLYRVRIGPVPNVPQFDRIVAALERVGVRDAHLALD